MNTHERTLADNVILVSKTNLEGKITYANQEFIKIVGYTEKELIGKPHSIIRHKDMPRIIFKILWDTIKDSKEVNTYIINRCKDGSYYWVFANVVASINIHGQTLGYHSTRRKPRKEALEIIIPLYKNLLELEKRGGMDASLKALEDILEKKGISYDEFILSC